MRIRRQETSVVLVVGAVLIAGACGGGSPAEGTGGETGGDSSGNGDGDAFGDGDSSAQGDGDGDGDVGGSSTGGDGQGSGGVDPGTGGDGSSSGGQTTMGGAASTGGNGTGGGPETVTTATLGDPCDSPGDFACAATNEKLALLCDGSGEWVTRETCTADSVCDANEGSGLGTCRTRLPECDLYSGSYCDDQNRAVECAPGGFETVVLEDCSDGYACQNGVCNLVEDACPEPRPYTYNCSGDACGGKPNVCIANNSCDFFGGTLYEDTIATVRIPVEDLCALPECGKPYYQLILAPSNEPELEVRYRVGPGWGMVPLENGEGDFCGDVIEGCVVIPPFPTGGRSRGVTLVPLTDNPVIRNVTIELVPPGTTCD